MIRDEGAMNAAISSDGLSNQDLQSYLDTLPNMNGLDLAKSVSCDSPYLFNKASDKKHKIAAIDFGIKLNILRILESHGCEIKVFPAQTKSDEILAYNPDGVFLSKVFMGSIFIEIDKKAKKCFKKVVKFKPLSSNKESKEIYIYCKGI